MQRDNTIDILKGLAIICIVQCHAAWILPLSGFNIGDFTCTFHVMSFVFSAGYLFRGISSKKEMYAGIGKRFVKLWYLFFSYSAVLLLLNPLFVKLHILAPEGRLSPIRGLYQAMLMLNDQQLLYPMWFVPMFLIATCIFTAVFAFAQQRKHKLFWHCAAAAVCGLAGLYSYVIEFFPQYYANASLLCVPVIYGGYLCSVYKDKVMKYVKWWTSFIAAFIMLVILATTDQTIDISSYKIISPLMFYPVTALGIYMALGFAKGLARVPYLSSFLSLAGRNSFHIMALHLLGFKIVDLFWGLVSGAAPAVYEKFPTAFDFWYIYLIFGTLFSIAVAELGKFIISRFKAKTLVHQ